MYKIIGADGVEYGPATAEQIRQWIREGRANAQTSIKLDTEAEWRPLGQMPEFASDFAAPPPAIPAPPIFPDADTTAAVSMDEVVSRDYTLDIGLCLSRAWELFKANAGLLVGVATVFMLITLGCSAIPVVGGLINLVISGPLYGGLFLVFLKLMRGQPAAFPDLFEGFNQCFTNLMLTQIVVGILTCLSGILVYAGIILNLVVHAETAHVIGWMLILVGMIPVIYLSVSWMYAIILAMDKGLDFRRAMELSRQKTGQHWFMNFALVLVGTVLAILGLLCCFVGVLVTVPVFIAAFVYAYEDIFGPGPVQKD